MRLLLLFFVARMADLGGSPGCASEEEGADMPGLDDQLKALQTDFDIPEERLEPFRTAKIREDLENALKEGKKVPDLEQTVRKLESAPKRTKALKDYGIDLDNLRPAELEAIEGFEWAGDEPTDEEIAAFAQRYDLPTSVEGEPEGEEPTPAQILGEGRRGGETPRGRRGEISAATVESWPAERWAAFEQQYPDQARQILEGETVQAPVGVS